MRPFKFTATEVFRWYEDRLVGEYHPGMTYTCSESKAHDSLYEKCKEWVSEGKIVIL